MADDRCVKILGFLNSTDVGRRVGRDVGEEEAQSECSGQEEAGEDRNVWSLFLSFVIGWARAWAGDVACRL